ncbi:MAG: YfiR family protein [Acidobacteriota bacterium]
MVASHQPLRRMGLAASLGVASLTHAPLPVAFSAPVAAAGPTVAEVKAAFLYNFTKFTEWPVDALPPVAPLLICIAEGSPVHPAIQEVTKGGVVRGHPVVVRQTKRDGPFDGCHLLYVEGLNEKSALQLLEKLHGAPVLSVSDFNRFAQLGGSAHLFIEDGRMRFAVNLDATRRIQLRLSALFLSLARIVSDDPNYRSPR